NNKGDGIYETIEDGNYSFFGSNALNIPTNMWIKNTDEKEEYTYNWDLDFTLLGQANMPFFCRGGHCDGGNSAGLFKVDMCSGYPSYNTGFRLALF
ncbi:MAG: hypothetical protein RSC92_00395, partial [Clostridia bacterium]